MQKIFRLLLVVSAIVLGALWFAHWSKIRALNSGEVHLRPQPQTTPTQPAAPSTDAANQPTQPQEVASNGAGPSADQPAALPTSESHGRNPPGTLVAAGSGKFQLYRQGDITFRLNTENGQACVLFATDAQWRKPLVYDNGCAGH